MGCFLGCFGSSKDRKRRKQRYKVIPRDQNPKSQNLVQAEASFVQSIKDRPSSPLPEPRGKNEKPLNLITRKKVTFDTNVTTYEHVQIYDSTESLLEKNEKGETFPKSAEPEPHDGSDRSYPPNYRYGNCVESDDEVDYADYEDEDSDDGLEDEDDYDDEDRIICQEVWCESIPDTVPSSESRVESSLIDKVGSNSNARDRSASVLNPVENLTQWKALKSKGTPPPLPLNFNPEKENSSLNSTPSKNRNQEMAVDASLSNWLGSSTPNNMRVGCYKTELEAISSGKSLSQGSTTPPVRNIEDRPILGALTEEELRQFSTSSSTPRKSPGRSPDDMPIIGSVGSYWSHTGSAKSLSSTSSYKGIPNTTSKYREVYL